MQYLSLEFSQKKSANVELYSVSNISLIMFSKSSNRLLIIVNKSLSGFRMEESIRGLWADTGV